MTLSISIGAKVRRDTDDRTASRKEANLPVIFVVLLPSQAPAMATATTAKPPMIQPRSCSNPESPMAANHQDAQQIRQALADERGKAVRIGHTMLQ